MNRTLSRFLSSVLFALVFPIVGSALITGCAGTEGAGPMVSDAQMDPGDMDGIEVDVHQAVG